MLCLELYKKVGCDRLLFSEDSAPLGWSEAVAAKLVYGTKGALICTLPRPWTPPFILFAASAVNSVLNDENASSLLARAKKLASAENKLIVRSSVVGESIWERGTYKSVVVATNTDSFGPDLAAAVELVRASARGRQIGLVIQRYVQPRARGEFGNLARISKTRDHWELSTVKDQKTIELADVYEVVRAVARAEGIESGDHCEGGRKEGESRRI